MILVTVGTQGPFDRLVKTVDQWAQQHPEWPCFAQIGPSEYDPQGMPFAALVTGRGLKVAPRVGVSARPARPFALAAGGGAGAYSAASKTFSIRSGAIRRPRADAQNHRCVHGDRAGDL